jgi:hypothetical protein
MRNSRIFGLCFSDYCFVGLGSRQYSRGGCPVAGRGGTLASTGRR